MAEVQPVIERLARAIDDIGGLRARCGGSRGGPGAAFAGDRQANPAAREWRSTPTRCTADPGSAGQAPGQEIARCACTPFARGGSHACLRQNLNADRIEVIADPSREPGSVQFETPRGNLDAGVESQLQEIERGLADRLRKQS
jgi:flagellar assembly protein FliH